MDIMVHVFLEHREHFGKIHLARHLEVEEVAVHVDATLHQVVIHNGGGEFIHEIASTAVAIHRAVDAHLAFQFVEVESGQVHVNSAADFGNGILFIDVQRMEVGFLDDCVEVGFGMLRVFEVNQAAEIKGQVFIVHLDFSIEEAFLHGAIQIDLVNPATQNLSIAHHAIHVQFGFAFLGEFHGKISIQVQLTKHLGVVDERAHIHPITDDVARKHVVARAAVRPCNVGVNLSHPGVQHDFRLEIVVGAFEVERDPTLVHDTQRLGQRDGLRRRGNVEIHQIVIGEVHVLDVHRMIAVIEIQRMHAQASLDLGRLPEFRDKIIHAEMLDRTREKAFELNTVRHLVHHRGEDANVGKHDVGGTNRGVKSDLVYEIVNSRIVVIQHVEVHVEQAVVGLHVHPVEVDAV